ncbi:hypothetical protein RAD15_28930 [Bradyrhizobium sp. 14AA]
MRWISFGAILALVLVLVSANSAWCQTDTIDGRGFVELSLKAISGSSPSDRRVARSIVSSQLSQLPASMRASATSALASKLRSDDTKSNQDILAILATVSTTWSTASTKDDMNYLYNLLSQSSDETSRTLVDSALANAKGSYKDGIAGYNSTLLPELTSAVQPLSYVAQTFPKSRYAERASFYLGHLYSKEYLLQDPRDTNLLKKSNLQLEDYIKKAEQGDFAKADYLAAGYYYRGLNSWLLGDFADALSWLSKGKNKFSNADQIYVYQLFVSTNGATVIDRYLPAQSAFATTINYLNRAPQPPADQSADLVWMLKSLQN